MTSSSSSSSLREFTLSRMRKRETRIAKARFSGNNNNNNNEQGGGGVGGARTLEKEIMKEGTKGG